MTSGFANYQNMDNAHSIRQIIQNYPYIHDLQENIMARPHADDIQQQLLKELEHCESPGEAHKMPLEVSEDIKESIRTFTDRKRGFDERIEQLFRENYPPTTQITPENEHCEILNTRHYT